MASPIADNSAVLLEIFCSVFCKYPFSLGAVTTGPRSFFLTVPLFSYVNCHETSLVIIILTGGLTNNIILNFNVLLFYWRKRISFTLQYYNAWIINQAYLKLNNCGGGNIHRDLELDNIF